MKQKKILVMIPMAQAQRNRLEQILPEAEYLYTNISDVTEEQIQQAEIILGNVPADMIQASAIWLGSI